MEIKLSDIVRVKGTNQILKVKSIIKTYPKSNGYQKIVTYKLEDGNEYLEEHIKFEKSLTRDDKLKNILNEK